ncbi:MAG: hypothetical protein DIU80_010000 [Chloroflexota bacterium]|nr:MAG: hypothetical protein DIU80_00870 [Chloroflexota bacterium]
MAPRFSRPRLIDANDKQYRAFLAQIMLTKENQRAIRPPRARDLFGGEAEEALRGWLAQHYTLSERRIVEYLEHRGRQAIKKYRELDAVVLPDPKTVHVFEIKASQKAVSLRRAVQQLRDTQTILRMLFARVYTTILLVDTGIPQTKEEAEQQLAERLADLAARGITPDRPLDPPPTLDEVLADLPQVRRVASVEEIEPDPQIVSLLRFGVDDIIALAGAENLHLDWDEEEELAEEGDEGEAEAESYAYSTGGDEEDDEDNPFAAALKRALQESSGSKDS